MISTRGEIMWALDHRLSQSQSSPPIGDVQPDSPFISINTVTAHSVKNITIATTVAEATVREYIVYSAIKKRELISRISRKKKSVTENREELTLQMWQEDAREVT